MLSQEAYCPDPTISSHMGAAAVIGLQGGIAPNASSYLPDFSTSAISLAKHAAGYGGPSGGVNGGVNMVNNRTMHDV